MQLCSSKDGAWNCNGAVTAAKGGTLCTGVGSNGIVECTSTRETTAVGESPWLLQGAD
jgi:hypothetical protein